MDHTNQQYIDKLDDNRKRHNSVIKGLSGDVNNFNNDPNNALSPMNIALKAKRNARDGSPNDTGGDDGPFSSNANGHQISIDVQE